MKLWARRRYSFFVVEANPRSSRSAVIFSRMVPMVASRGVTIGSQAHRGAVLDETSEGGQQSSSLLGAAAKRLSSNPFIWSRALSGAGRRLRRSPKRIAQDNLR